MLDCWGGQYAAVAYKFGSLPGDARYVSRRIIGSTYCCSPGQVLRQWKGNTAYVAVTGWRSYVIDRVRIRYQHRVPVRTVTKYYDTGSAEWPTP
jgi:hypothetical protein